MPGQKEEKIQPEFRLHVAPAINERTGQPTTLVVRQPTK